MCLEDERLLTYYKVGQKTYKSIYGTVSETSQEEGRNYLCLGKSRKRLQTAHVNMNWSGNVLVDTDDDTPNKGKMHLGTTVQQSFNYTISQ